MQCIGLCPTLAVTTSVANGVGMGLAATFVLIASNAVISLLRKMVPDEVRIPIFIVVIAGFVTVIEFLMKGFAPELNKSLGIFIPLIVVNCIILARAEAFASKNGVIASALDGVGMGLGFTIALTFLGSIREIFGAGTWLGMPVVSFEPAMLFLGAAWEHSELFKHALKASVLLLLKLLLVVGVVLWRNSARRTKTTARRRNNHDYDGIIIVVHKLDICT